MHCKSYMWIIFPSCHAVLAGVMCANKTDWLTGLLFCIMTAHGRRRKTITGSERRNSAAAVNAQGWRQDEGPDQQFSPETGRGPDLPPRLWARPSMEGHTWRCPTPEAWSWFWIFSCCPHRPQSHWRRKTAFLWNPVSLCQGEMDSIYTLHSDHSSMTSQRAVVLLPQLEATTTSSYIKTGSESIKIFTLSRKLRRLFYTSDKQCQYTEYQSLYLKDLSNSYIGENWSTQSTKAG